MSNDKQERREYEEWCHIRDEGPPPAKVLRWRLWIAGSMEYIRSTTTK